MKKEKYDLILVHPPSIFDFRNRDDVLFAFSSSSSIGVSPVYEMYPLGLKAIETYLRQQGKKSKIINLADMMLKNPDMNVTEYLKSLHARMFGIDLHWLAHAQGSLAVAKILKELHPDVPILFGGISASYFHNELIKYPQVDFVLRGVDTPHLIFKLINNLNSDEYHGIENLCWKNKDNIVVINAFFNTHNFNCSVDWIYTEKEINYYMVFSGAGCEYNCTFCSGAKHSMHKHMGVNNGFADKDLSLFVNEITSIKDHSAKNSTVIALHHWFEDIDLLNRVLKSIELSNIKTIHLTLYKLLPREHIQLISNYNIRPYFELSIQSSSEGIRKLCGNPSYSNDDMETWLNYLYGQNRKAIVAIFFMIGLPHQTEKDVMNDIAYAEYLFKKYNQNELNIFISPMRPFLDPGSAIYDNPDKFGYKLFFNTLHDYEKALLVPHWKDSLNYETQWLTRKQIVDVSYKALRELMRVKERALRMPRGLSKSFIDKIDATVHLLSLIEQYDSTSLPQDIRRQILDYNNEILGSSISQQSPFEFRTHKYWYEE